MSDSMLALLGLFWVIIFWYIIGFLIKLSALPTGLGDLVDRAVSHGITKAKTKFEKWVNRL